MKKEHTPWVWPSVHPEAEKLPMMSDAEIWEMANDIFENGLREPIDIWIDNREEANGSPGPFPKYHMDGRCRREALKLLGHDSPFDVNTNGVRYHNAIKRRGKKWVTDCDPVKFILSKNVHRRHLTPEQRREAIKRFLKADPTASNREVGKTLHVSHHTIKKVRDEAVRDGQIAQNEQPIERAKTTLREDQTLTVRELTDKADVSLGTAQKAKKLVAIESKTEPRAEPEEKPEPEPIDAEQEIKKKVERFRATVQKTLTSWTKQWLEEIGFDAMQKIIKVEARAWRDNTAALYRSP